MTAPQWVGWRRSADHRPAPHALLVLLGPGAGRRTHLAGHGDGLGGARLDHGHHAPLSWATALTDGGTALLTPTHHSAAHTSTDRLPTTTDAPRLPAPATRRSGRSRDGSREPAGRTRASHVGGPADTPIKGRPSHVTAGGTRSGPRVPRGRWERGVTGW